MKKKINYGRQFIDKQDIKSVIHSLKNDLITTGNLVDLFEKNISKKFNCKYAFTCSSGTAGLHLAYSAIGLKKNDIVLMPTINLGSCKNILILIGKYLGYLMLYPEKRIISKSGNSVLSRCIGLPSAAIITS